MFRIIDTLYHKLPRQYQTWMFRTRKKALAAYPIVYLFIPFDVMYYGFVFQPRLYFTTFTIYSR